MLEIKNLHVKLEEEDKQILKGVDLTVEAGKVHAIMGPNGSGKSTLSYVLSGRDGYEVTEGSATLNGEDLLEMEPEERAAAPALFETMNLAAEKLAEPNAQWSDVNAWATKRLLTAGFSSVDYLNLVDTTSLSRLERADCPARLLAAAWIGKTRLIDNIPVTGPQS